jgi:hypothetical protein
MRLLLRNFSPSSWLALAASGIVLDSCAMAPPDVTAPRPLAGHTVAAIWSPPFWVAGDPLTTTHPQVRVDWISATDHYVSPARCHPHCQDNQLDTETIQESYPPNLENDAFGLLCRGSSGHTGNPCGFEYPYFANDRTRHLVTITWPNRPDEVWFTLVAYH